MSWELLKLQTHSARRPSYFILILVRCKVESRTPGKRRIQNHLQYTAQAAESFLSVPHVLTNLLPCRRVRREDSFVATYRIVWEVAVRRRRRKLQKSHLRQFAGGFEVEDRGLEPRRQSTQRWKP